MPIGSGIIVGGSGVLYVVATPIGNLGDLSPRAREVLAGVAVVAAEDTRHTGQLLRTLGISGPLVALHEHNERAAAPGLVERLEAGESVALVSDAGTPLLSDPGFHLVRAARAAGIAVVPIPGPCAAVAALSVAGLPTDRFCFEGFLPARAGPRRARLTSLAAEPRTLVFYEAPHRIRELIADLVLCFGAVREAALAREVTKAHEAHYRGTLVELAAAIDADANAVRGEHVLVVAGNTAALAVAEGDALLDRALAALLAELPVSQAADLAARICLVPRNRAYARALEVARERG
jgi:16S rRNA (cytidine1402-2'-O)-methyltransferase